MKKSHYITAQGRLREWKKLLTEAADKEGYDAFLLFALLAVGALWLICLFFLVDEFLR